MDMNKRMIVLIALVVAVFAVPASAETLEVRGDVVDLDPYDAQTADLVWNATNFGAFWYDLDDNLMTEELTITAGTLSMWDRTIDEDCLIYQTSPVYQQYEVNMNEGLTVDDDTGYYLEGWMAERYVAINGKADTLCELLVEFEDDDNKTLILGENWSLGGGFSLVVSDIDLEGTKIRFYLRKDGLELDNKTVSVGEVYTYTAEIGGEENIPVFSCYVNAIIKETNITQVKYVFLIDDDVLEIDTGDEFGIMEATASSNYINLSNKEDTVDLGAGNTEHIMGNMYFRTADNDDAGEDHRLRFYPFVEYTEPGTYEIRAAVLELAIGATTSPLYMWDATNFAAFWYDLDEDLRTESLWIEAGSLSHTQRTISYSANHRGE
jgi:S-layer protein (TIGR01567 family)